MHLPLTDFEAWLEPDPYAHGRFDLSRGEGCARPSIRRAHRSSNWIGDADSDADGEDTVSSPSELRVSISIPSPSSMVSCDNPANSSSCDRLWAGGEWKA